MQVLLNGEPVITLPVETVSEGDMIIDQLFPDTQYTFIALLVNAVGPTVVRATHTTSSGKSD